MKKAITKRLATIILAFMILTLCLNYMLQIHNARNDMYLDAKNKFWQINQILKQNEKETEQVKEDLKANCLIRAKAAAYILQYRPEITEDQEEMEKIARLLQVDEFHLFNKEGTLYAGSEPKYFGLNFTSGEQMQFFLPMLKDRELELCQDITPNTAEQKLMQYAAVWREDGEGIVQIGLEPDRVLESMKKNELSYIFSLVTADSGTTIYAIDPGTYQILGCTDAEQAGKNITDIGVDLGTKMNQGFSAKVNGEDSYCVFADGDSVILGITESNRGLYKDVNSNCLLTAVYLVLISIIMIVSISKYMDYYVVRGISSVNQRLEKITKGNLDTKVEVETTPEFKELSGRINLMVDSLLDTTNKLTKILEAARVPIGVYEYNKDMKRVMATGRVADILMLTEEEARELLLDHVLFEKKLEDIRLYPVTDGKDVYRLPGEGEHFIRMNTFSNANSILGIIIDVTEDMVEKQHIEKERDIDLLTGLYSRRAFYRKMEELFKTPEELGHAVILMADADNLKKVNDDFGHENGDRYLQGIAGILRSCKADKQVLARISGDEFVVFLYQCPDREALSAHIRKLLLTMGGSTVELSNTEEIPVRFSVGCAYYPEDGRDYHELLSLADHNMYQSKRNKKELEFLD